MGTHNEFNLLNYRRANRRFVMGKLITYVDQQLLTLEFSAGDTADAPMIVDAFDRVAAALYNGDDLAYRPVSARHEDMLAEISDRVPVVRTEDVFLGQTYQPLNQGWASARCDFAEWPSWPARPQRPTDIVVLDRVPNDVPLMVSGIITAEFQTPLSPRQYVLSKNRGTPNMALRGAFDDPALRQRSRASSCASDGRRPRSSPIAAGHARLRRRR